MNGLPANDDDPTSDELIAELRPGRRAGGDAGTREGTERHPESHFGRRRSRGCNGSTAGKAGNVAGISLRAKKRLLLNSPDRAGLIAIDW
jgi:hypothetical protein